MIEFTGCKYLDFKTEYHHCKKQMMGDGKVFWDRETINPDLPRMVQFCRKRGRLNDPMACTEFNRAVCNEYHDHKHIIPESEIDT